MVGGHTLQQHGNKRRLHDSVTTGSPSLSAASISHFPKKDQAGGVGVEKTECSSPASFPSLSNSAISIGTGISTRQYDTGVKHILVVDDNPIIVRILTRMLESVSGSSISINTALNGYDAISKLIAFSTSSLPIDLILMDLEMPFLNGLNTAREIRRLKHSDHEESQSLAQRRETERLAATLIVGLTGDVRESRFMEARESGMDDCIGKPVTKETLRGLIQTIFTAKRGRQAEGIRLKLEGPALCSNGIPVAPGDGMTGAGVCKG
jgi:CheY-like chemotaxis protein